jgi:hypothetical protein
VKVGHAPNRETAYRKTLQIKPLQDSRLVHDRRPCQRIRLFSAQPPPHRLQISARLCEAHNNTDAYRGQAGVRRISDESSTNRGNRLCESVPGSARNRPAHGPGATLIPRRRHLFRSEPRVSIVPRRASDELESG